MCMRMGWGSGVVSSWCFCMKLQFMNIPVALESRSVDIEMDAREVREVSVMVHLVCLVRMPPTISNHL